MSFDRLVGVRDVYIGYIIIFKYHRSTKLKIMPRIIQSAFQVL